MAEASRTRHPLPSAFSLSGSNYRRGDYRSGDYRQGYLPILSRRPDECGHVGEAIQPGASHAKRCALCGGLPRLRPRGKQAPGAARAPWIGKIPQRNVRLVWLTNRRPETAGKRQRQLPPRCTERLDLRLGSGRRTEPRGQRRLAPDDEVPKLKRESPRLARQCRRRELTNEGGRLSSRPLARWLLPR